MKSERYGGRQNKELNSKNMINNLWKSHADEHKRLNCLGIRYHIYIIVDSEIKILKHEH